MRALEQVKNGGKNYFRYSFIGNRWDFRGSSSFHRCRKWYVEQPGWRFVMFLVILGWLYWNSQVFMRFLLSYFESWVPWGSQYHASDWAFPDCSELFPSYFWALKNNKAPRYSFISIWSFFLTLMACLTYAKIDDNSLWLKSDATEYESSPTAVRNIYFTAIGIGLHKIFSLETRSWFQGIIKTGFFFSSL